MHICNFENITHTANLFGYIHIVRGIDVVGVFAINITTELSQDITY